MMERIRYARTALIIALVIGGLASLDKTLARVESSEMRDSAAHAFHQGQELLARGKAAEAVDELSRAHALDRDNPEYALALVAGLTKAGKTTDADALMNEVLDQRPNDGEANLTAARLMVKEGEPGDAEAYYHRAIYGNWPSDASARKRQVRMELIDLLRKQDARQNLLAELISLEAESGGDENFKKRLAKLFLDAGSPARAVTVYRDLIATQSKDEMESKDAGLFEGLGEAYLEQGQYRAAQSAFSRAAALDPKSDARARLSLVTEVAELDPTPRGLTSMEKYSRSIKLLSLARNDLAAKSPAPGDDIRQLLKEADDQLSQKPPRNPSNEIAEHLLELAGRIWKARLAAYGPKMTPEEEPLRLCMDKLLPAS
jgi:tetratricopeptide (TPR) repeat protein